MSLIIKHQHSAIQHEHLQNNCPVTDSFAVILSTEIGSVSVLVRWDRGSHVVTNGDLRLRASVAPLTMNYHITLKLTDCSVSDHWLTAITTDLAKNYWGGEFPQKVPE